MSSAKLREALARDGFVVMPNILSQGDLNAVRTVCHHTTDLARAGQWPYFRTLPKQFPPWSGDASQGIWGVQHLLHPDMPGRDVYAKTYFSPTIVNAVTSLLDCEEDDLVMELYNLLVRPDRDFALRWHRDDIQSNVSAEEELERLEAPVVHAQWNLALYADHSLLVVPGSHRRARTDAERKADPFEANMPGQKVVTVHPGDVVFYNNNILHRGVYDSTVERMTLHGSMGITKADPARARNILQHGIGTWAPKCEFNELTSSVAVRAERMKQNLIAMGSGGETSFSHAD